MRRFSWSLVALGLVSWTTGCQLCQNPYDYCGPIQHEGMYCDPHDVSRMGSAFTGGPIPGSYAPPVHSRDESGLEPNYFDEDPGRNTAQPISTQHPHEAVQAVFERAAD